MEEKVLKGKKNGMSVMIFFILLYVLALAVCIVGSYILDEGKSAVLGGVLLTVSIIWLSIGWIPFMGLKVLKPQEALVLTLFGKYVGTLKEEGFYYVNPFCVSVNPASKTKLNQSGDVDSGKRSSLQCRWGPPTEGASRSVPTPTPATAPSSTPRPWASPPGTAPASSVALCVSRCARSGPTMPREGTQPWRPAAGALSSR